MEIQEKVKNSIGKRALAAVWQTILAFALLLIVWWIAHRLVGNELLLPALSDCAQKAVGFLTDSSFWTAFWATFGRVITVFTFSFILASIFAFVAYLVPWFKNFFAPFLAILRAMPVLAALLVILV